MKMQLNIYQKWRYFLLFSFFMLAVISINAQTNNASNEVKFNLLGLAIGLPEISYERLLNERMGLGISAALGIKNDNVSSNVYKFMITPHYRYYFGRKYANGLFLEASATVLSDDAEQANDGGIRKDKTYYGLGGGVGMKHVFGKGLVAELLLGLGGKLNKQPVKDKGTDLGLYKRIGLSIGKRF